MNTTGFVSTSVTSGTDAYDRVVTPETLNTTTSMSKTVDNQTAPVTNPDTSLSTAGIETAQSEASGPGSHFTSENPTDSSPNFFATTDTLVLQSGDYTAAPTNSSSNWTKHNKASLDDRTTRICLVIGVFVGLSALIIVLAILGKICFDNYWLRKDYTNIDQDLQFIFQ